MLRRDDVKDELSQIREMVSKSPGIQLKTAVKRRVLEDGQTPDLSVTLYKSLRQTDYPLMSPFARKLRFIQQRSRFHSYHTDPMTFQTSQAAVGTYAYFGISASRSSGLISSSYIILTFLSFSFLDFFSSAGGACSGAVGVAEFGFCSRLLMR